MEPEKSTTPTSIRWLVDYHDNKPGDISVVPEWNAIRFYVRNMAVPDDGKRAAPAPVVETAELVPEVETADVTPVVQVPTRRSTVTPG